MEAINGIGNIWGVCSESLLWSFAVKYRLLYLSGHQSLILILILKLGTGACCYGAVVSTAGVTLHCKKAIHHDQRLLLPSPLADFTRPPHPLTSLYAGRVGPPRACCVSPSAAACVWW